MTAKDERCDICNNESPDAQYVGVASVPGAPVSIAWCQNCLQNNTVPSFVVETWLFTEWAFNDGTRTNIPMPVERPEFPLADWAGEMTLWRNNSYITIKEAWPDLWEEERARHTVH